MVTRLIAVITLKYIEISNYCVTYPEQSVVCQLYLKQTIEKDIKSVVTRSGPWSETWSKGPSDEDNQKVLTSSYKVNEYIQYD